MAASANMPRPRGLLGQLEQAEAGLAYWHSQLRIAKQNLAACRSKIEQIEVVIERIEGEIRSGR